MFQRFYAHTSRIQGYLYLGGMYFRVIAADSKFQEKMKGYLFSEGYLFTGFYGIVIALSPSFDRTFSGTARQQDHRKAFCPLQDSSVDVACAHYVIVSKIDNLGEVPGELNVQWHLQPSKVGSRDRQEATNF